MTAGVPLRDPRPRRTLHNALGRTAAGLFFLFFVAGVVTLLTTLPRHSCAGVVPTHYDTDTVQSAGAGQWANVPSGNCVEVISGATVATAGSSNTLLPGPTGTTGTTGTSGTGTTGGGLVAGNAFDLGAAPEQYSGAAWQTARITIVAWCLWTLGMVLLAAAVAAVPPKRRES